METITSKVKPNKKISVDFSVIPAGILLLDVSGFLTEFLKLHIHEFWKLILARVIHFIFLLLLCYSTNKIFKMRKITELLFSRIVLLGLILSGISLLTYHLLFNLFDIITLTLSHTLMVNILQGAFWFPVLMIIGGSRTEIINAFESYEKRLLVQTRKTFKKTTEYEKIQRKIEDEIRYELVTESNKISNLLSKIDTNQELTQINNNIQQVLSGKELRTLSLKLGQKSDTNSQSNIIGQDLHTIIMVSKQFRILYRATAQNAPLAAHFYVGLLVALTLPAFINFFTLVEAIISLIPLALFAFFLARINIYVLKSGLKNSFLFSSLLILSIGFLPFIENQIGQRITDDPKTIFPIIITAFTFPLGYHIIIRFLQIIQPKAIILMESNQLEASKSLKIAINKIVTEELTQTISHRWAIYIHGKVLTTLAATALKLEQSSNLNDRQSFITALSNLQKLLANPTVYFDETPLTLENEIQTRLNPWEGLLNISIYIDPMLVAIQNERIRDLGEAVEEIISNSIRHGGAQNITLKITPINQMEIEILVDDDAVNKPSDYPARVGLGTKIFNLVSDGRWVHTHQGLSSQFKMTVAITE